MKYGKIYEKTMAPLRRYRIFYRFLSMFVLAMLLPMLFFSIWSYQKNSRVIRERVYDSVNAVLDRIAGEVEQKVEKIRNDSIEISYLPRIQDAIVNYCQYNSRELNKIKLDMTKEMSNKYAFDNIVSSIILYTPDHEKIKVFGDDIFMVNLSNEYLQDFLQVCEAEDGKCVFRAVNEDCQTSAIKLNRKAIIAGKAVKQGSNGIVIGYLVLQIDEQNFSEIYQDISEKMGGVGVILDENGITVSATTGHAETGSLYPDDEIREALLKMNENTPELSVQKNRMVVLSRKIEDNGWTLYFMIPEEYLQGSLANTLASFILISIVCIFFAVIITFVFSYSIIVPLNSVRKGIRAFENGNMHIVLDESGSDEITELSVQFNRMVTKILELLEHVKKDEKQKRRLEIQALQAQINPHFLANTLNTVSYTARLKKDQVTEIQINAIIELMRSSMKNDGSFHTVEDEIELIKNYITLQDYRLLGRFSVDMQIDDDIRSCKIPRFILQPIVENAVIHGIEPIHRRGNIYIRGYHADSQLLFMIMDNGAGMDPEQIGRMMENKQNLEKSRLNGVGVGNVQERIQLLFGADYGLTVKSRKNQFTSVTMNLPLLRKETEK